MWTTDYSDSTSAGPAAVWASLTALHSGTPLGPHSDAFELHGPFAVGTTLTITPQGQDPMQSTIVELKVDEVYADQTVHGELMLTFRHQLTRLDDGGTRVTHTLEISGPGADEVGPDLGPQISGDFPVTMGELIVASEARTVAGMSR
ncbi:MAG: polyketide cyclase [Kineosporiaceae bacterium]|nr:polyketide cyclase [Aeromicrobium sp.]